MMPKDGPQTGRCVLSDDLHVLKIYGLSVLYNVLAKKVRSAMISNIA